MAEKSIALMATVLVILGLLVGGIFMYTLFPREVTKEVIKEVQVPGPEVIKEVTKEVIKEVPAPSELDKAVATFMIAVDKEEDEAGNDIDLQNGYDFKEISVKDISDEYTVAYSEDKVVVEFEITLKYKDSHDSEKEVYNIRVTSETDEDTIVACNNIDEERLGTCELTLLTL